MTTRWDHSADLVIAGSGGGGMVAGLAALDCGLEPLIIEKQPLVGGSTGLSGGIVWLPNNPLMRADGIADSHEDGLAYLADVVGDIGAPSSPERREMFLTAGFEMINFLTRKGVELIRCAGWSDYYPNHKGGNASGRAVEGIPFDAAKLGSWSDKVQPPLAKNYGYVVLTNELRSVQYFNRAPRAFAVASARHRPVWRISTAPAQAHRLVDLITPAAQMFYDWGGGLVWLGMPYEDEPDAGSVRMAVGELGGHATLIRAPAEVRAAVDVFQPEPPGLRALSHRVKESFDPKGVLNPGRMWAGI